MRPNRFIALPLPVVDREGAPWFPDGLARPPGGTRLLAPGDLHLTVAFLGPVDEAAARAAWEVALARPPLGPLPVSLGPVQLFGHPRRGTALAATVDEGDAALCEEIAAWRGPLLEAAGARPDTRPPRPHATLARIRRRADPRQRQAALAWAAAQDLSGGGVTLDRLALYTWADDRPRRLFRIVAARPR